MITKPLFFVLRIIPNILLVIIIISFFNVSLSNLEKSEIERFSSELAENIIHSDLTISRAVFNITELEKYNKEKTEPYVRHCKFAYYIEIEALETPEEALTCDWAKDCKSFCIDVCNLDENSIDYSPNQGMLVKGQGNCGCIVRRCECIKEDDDEKIKQQLEWKFGYQPSFISKFFTEDKIDVVKKEYPVSIYDNSVKPAKLTLTIYDTWLTRGICLIEKAYKQKEIQEMTIPSLNLREIRNKDNNPETNQVCSHGLLIDRDCRYLEGAPLIHFVNPGSVSDDVVMKAIPIKKGITLPSKGECDEINSNMIAKKDDEVGSVAVCIGDDK